MSSVERLTKQDVIDSPRLGFWVHAGDFNQKIEQGQLREAELQQRLTAADERDDQRKELLQMFIDNSDDKDVVELCMHALNTAEVDDDEAI